MIMTDVKNSSAVSGATSSSCALYSKLSYLILWPEMQRWWGQLCKIWTQNNQHRNTGWPKYSNILHCDKNSEIQKEPQKDNRPKFSFLKFSKQFKPFIPLALKVYILEDFHKLHSKQREKLICGSKKVSNFTIQDIG